MNTAAMHPDQRIRLTATFKSGVDANLLPIIDEPDYCVECHKFETYQMIEQFLLAILNAETDEQYENIYKYRPPCVDYLWEEGENENAPFLKEPLVFDYFRDGYTTATYLKRIVGIYRVDVELLLRKLQVLMIECYQRKMQGKETLQRTKSEVEK